MLRREAASWLARLQSGREPDIERKFEQWRNADPRHALGFNHVRQSYEQAGLLRYSAGAATHLDQPTISTRRWQPRPALAAAALAAVLVPLGLVLVGERRPAFGGTDAVMLMSGIGQIR